MFRDIAKAAADALPLDDSSRFNWKDGFYNDEEKQAGIQKTTRPGFMGSPEEAREKTISLPKSRKKPRKPLRGRLGKRSERKYPQRSGAKSPQELEGSVEKKRSESSPQGLVFYLLKFRLTQVLSPRYSVSENKTRFCLLP
jgi:hypothetical protein